MYLLNDETHPQYASNYWRWQRNRRLYHGLSGERMTGSLIPSAGDGGGFGDAVFGSHDLLPAPRSMQLNAEHGRRMADDYRRRAVHHQLFGQAIDSGLGRVVSAGNPINPLDDKSRALIDTWCAPDCMSLYRYVIEELMISGRCLLLAMPTDGVPLITALDAESLLDWDVGKDGVVKYLKVHGSERVIVDGRGEHIDRIHELYVTDALTVRTTTKRAIGDDVITVAQPAIGGRRIPYVPAVIVGSSDTTGGVYPSIYDRVAVLDLAVYRAEADYRQHLHMCGQSTLVIEGEARGDDEDGGSSIRTGAGAVITVEQGGSVYYAGVTGVGLQEQRESIQRDIAEAKEIFGVVSSSGAVGEEAIRLRQESQMAQLQQLVQTTSSAINRCLTVCCEMSGSICNWSVDRVDIGATKTLTALELQQLATAKLSGLPISARSLHDNMRRAAMTGLTYDQEQQIIESESHINVGDNAY